MAGANTLAFYNTATITVVKSFIVQTLEVLQVTAFVTACRCHNNQHNDIQHCDTQHKELLCDTQHK